MIWSNWNWSKKYTPFGPTDNHLDQSKSNGPSDLVQGIHWPTSNYCFETGSKTGILEELKWESLKKRRRGSRDLKGAASISNR